MTEKNSEKAKIIFIEAKESLQFSNLNLEQLDQKISRFSSICVVSISSLTAVLSFSRLEQPQSTKFLNPVKSTIPSDIFYLLSYLSFHLFCIQ